MVIHIKNMVCPRCLRAVEHILDHLEITKFQISLGTVELKNNLTESQIKLLSGLLSEQGFELIDDRKGEVIENIKNILIDTIHHQNKLPTQKWSSFLAEKVALDYRYLSQLFSSVEGVTIEQYIMKLRVEKIKELLSYERRTLSEIAYLTGYSSVSHLSSQFKKITGMTPSEFKALSSKPRLTLDNL